MPVKCLLSRSQFAVVEALFDDLDQNHNGYLSKKEYIESNLSALPMMQRASKKRELLEVWASLKLKEDEDMTIHQMVQIFYPHIPSVYVRKIVNRYASKPQHRRPLKVDTSAEQVAKGNELTSLFNHMDSDAHGGIRRGYLHWSDLEVPLTKSGVGKETAQLWLQKCSSSCKSPRGTEKIGLPEFHAIFG